MPPDERRRSALSDAEDERRAAGVDQDASDRDQAASDRDQAASDRDQDASDRDLAHGGDPAVHDASRHIRARGADQRRHGNHRRSDAAVTRDSVAHARDLAAEARDRAAANLDRDLEQREAGRAAADRAAAGRTRTQAAADRAAAAHDREQAARDRAEAADDREALLLELAASEVDALTGTRARAPGLKDLDHEIERARRTAGLLAIAYIDVVGLKEVNDARGHSAGDALLKDAVRVIRSRLRSYDAIVRVGGDEFVCVMPGAAIQTARSRFQAVQTALAADPSECEIKVGIAALEPEDGATELIDRADAALPSSRA